MQTDNIAGGHLSALRAENLTHKWTGYVALLNAEKSKKVAKELGFKVNGSYALHIND